VAEVLEVLHDQGLHSGMEKVLSGLSKARLFVPRAKEWIKQYIASCPKCQAPRAPQQHGPMLVEPRWLPLSHVQCDFASITPTKVGGVTYVGVVLYVDMASRVCQMTLVEDATCWRRGGWRTCVARLAPSGSPLWCRSWSSPCS
jgi:hypothetical protein